MKQYQKMETFKVSFNAKEQVAAAGCDAWNNGSKFTNGTLALCDVVNGKLGNNSYAVFGCAGDDAGTFNIGGKTYKSKYQA